ncbi:uncharacterized protein A4U43_C08F17270 [Asparagus officinalis]|nr:uncharacterized protein A4U43_C08F17270 [Asparagus officinalis]
MGREVARRCGRGRGLRGDEGWLRGWSGLRLGGEGVAGGWLTEEAVLNEWVGLQGLYGEGERRRGGWGGLRERERRGAYTDGEEGLALQGRRRTRTGNGERRRCGGSCKGVA